MIKIIIVAVWHIVQILVGSIISVHGAMNGDYTQFGVGLIVMSLPTVDRIESRLEELNK